VANRHVAVPNPGTLVNRPPRIANGAPPAPGAARVSPFCALIAFGRPWRAALGIDGTNCVAGTLCASDGRAASLIAPPGSSRARWCRQIPVRLCHRLAPAGYGKAGAGLAALTPLPSTDLAK
jgi:hypothetical protein